MSFFKRLDQKFRAWNHRRIDAFRRWRLSLFLLLFNQKNKSPSPVNRKILILRLDGKLGDTITTSGFLQSLINGRFEVEIITRAENAFVYEYLPKPFKLYILKKGIGSFFKLLFALRNNTYAVIFCSTHILDPASLFFSRFVSAAKKIVYLNQQIHFFDVHIEKDFFSAHVTERLQHAFNAINTSPTSLDFYRLSIPAIAQTKAQDFYKQFRGKKVIVLNSFAGAKLRNFSFETTKSIVEKLTEKFIVVSIGNVGDLQILNQWKKQMMTSPSWIIPNDGDFAFNSALIQNSDLVITPDTSIVHLASALNRPVLAVFRKDQPPEYNSKIWAPLSENKKGHSIIYAPTQDINSVSVTDIVSKTFEMLN
jgi:ADP-heptose:LPS heptosyltransferase